MELRLLRWGHPGLSVLALKPMTSILNRDTQSRHQQREGPWRRLCGDGERLKLCRDGSDAETEVMQRLKWCGQKSSDAWSHQKLERQEKIIFQSLQRRIWPCQHLNFGHLASRIVIEWISLILTNKFVVTCFGNPRKLIQLFVAFHLSSHVWLFANLRTAAWKASLSLIISQSLAKFMSFALVMPSSYLILWLPLLLLSSIFPSIRDFSNESAVRIRWPKYWSFNFSISPSSEYSGLISLTIDWFDLLAVQGTLRSLLHHHSLKASILWCSAFFMVQLSYGHMWPLERS